MVEFTVGSEIAGLRIGPVAGRGGSSIVYKAVDLATGEPRAVKVLTSTDEGADRRLQREATLLAKVDHPAIVPFRGLFREGDRSLLVTDWVEGQSLHQYLRSYGPLSAEEALRLLRALAGPLDHLHGLGIVHRDITPANIIIGPRRRMTLIDLGIGHFIDTSTLTNEDLLAGTPMYLAPEVIRGHTADARSDQYSVAVMLHELVSGASPFPAADVIAAALHHQLTSIPTALDEINPTVAPRFSDAVLRALAKQPEERFGSMTEFAVAAARAAPTSRMIVGKRRRPALLAALALCAVNALIAGLAISGLLDGSGDTATDAPAELAAEPTTAAAVWEPGRAGEMACNLLSGHTFENGSVPVDYYGKPPGRERVIDRDGFEGSWALEVGQVDNYGQYGEIIDIDRGRSYLFRGWFEIRPPVTAAEFGVAFLDEAYDPIEGRATVGILSVSENDPPEPGFRQLIVDDIPANAVRAVPYLFKDSSPGVLLADELVFGPADDCTAELGN